MASKRQRKKNAKKLGVWEGQQYKGGRTKGRKNLKKTPSGFVNQHGVEFTTEERKALERAVNRSNRTRKKMLAQEAQARSPDSGETVSQLRLMGGGSDMILSRQSKSMQQFRSREEFESFMDKQRDIHSGKYLDDMTRHYKRNFSKALENAFGDDAKDIKMKIRMMKPDDYRKMVMGNDELEISYLYEPQARTAKLNKIRRVLGMREKETELEE